MKRLSPTLGIALAVAAAKAVISDGRGISVSETTFPEPGPAPQADIIRKAARTKRSAEHAAKQFNIGWIPYTISVDQTTPRTPRETLAAKKPPRNAKAKKRRK